MNSFKMIRCPQCDKHLYSRFGDSGFVLIENTEERIEVRCPECKGRLAVELGVVPGSSREVLCGDCNRTVQARRLADRVSVAFVGPMNESAPAGLVDISEDLLQKITEAMGPQPWQDGAAAIAANKIGITKRTMSSAVSTLIKRGVFKVQVDGQLYVPAEVSSGGKQTA
jgi:predicted Zn finger-like uncharacterized protein